MSSRSSGSWTASARSHHRIDSSSRTLSCRPSRNSPVSVSARAAISKVAVLIPKVVQDDPIHPAGPDPSLLEVLPLHVRPQRVPDTARRRSAACLLEQPADLLLRRTV